MLANMKLGRIKPDPAVLARVPALEKQLFSIQQPLDKFNRPKLFTPGLYKNDIYPNCSYVGLANSVRAFRELDDNSDLFIDESKVVQAYADYVGCTDLTKLDQTGGAYLVDVLKRQFTQGFDCGQEIIFKGHFASCNIQNRQELARSINDFGFSYWGVALAIADQSAEIWDANTAAINGDPTPGSWGGHCLIAYNYTGLEDTDLVSLATWGDWKEATWRWVESRLEEAYVVLWDQLLPITNKNWNNVNVEQLESELNSFVS